MLPRTDQVPPPHRMEGLAQQGPVVRVMPAQERLVQPPLPFTLDRFYRLGALFVTESTQRVAPTVIHGGGGGHG